LSLVRYNIDSEDDFKDFVLNKLIESSSLDDEDNSYFDATNILAHESLNEPLHRGSIVGHQSMDHERLSWHYLLYRDYFSDNSIFGLKYFRRRLVCSINYVFSICYGPHK
jgi:hypothetical protein